jgi:hypothetical protein
MLFVVGCGGGSSEPSALFLPTNAFVTAVKNIAANSPEDTEPVNIDALVATAPEYTEPVNI